MLYSFFLIIMKNVGRSSAFRPRYPNIYYRTRLYALDTDFLCYFPIKSRDFLSERRRLKRRPFALKAQKTSHADSDALTRY